MTVRGLLVMLAVVSMACGGLDDFTDEMPDDLPAGACPDTDTDACATSTGSAPDSSTGDDGGTTSSPMDTCEASDACLGDDACVAVWDAESEALGPFECQFTCVPLLDEALWCRDDSSCCDPQAHCTDRGYCVLDASGDTSTSG